MDTSGQAAISVRHALLAGDMSLALAQVSLLDEAHRIEILLGAAIRDDKEDFAAIRAWGVGDTSGLCHVLARPPVTDLDDGALRYIVTRVVSERWTPNGLPSPKVSTMGEAATALSNGASGLSLLHQLHDRLHYPAVRAYYTEGTIHALGCRPLLILAASPRRDV